MTKLYHLQNRKKGGKEGREWRQRNIQLIGVNLEQARLAGHLANKWSKVSLPPWRELAAPPGTILYNLSCGTSPVPSVRSRRSMTYCRPAESPMGVPVKV